MFILSAPALAKGSNRMSGFAHIKWTSKVILLNGRNALTTAGPKEMLGTKWPSMMSRCSQAAPVRLTRWTSAPRRVKLAASKDGAMIKGEAVMSIINSPPSCSLNSEGASNPLNSRGRRRTKTRQLGGQRFGHFRQRRGGDGAGWRLDFR